MLGIVFQIYFITIFYFREGGRILEFLDHVFRNTALQE